MAHHRRILLASLLGAWVAMVLACGGGTRKPNPSQPDAGPQPTKGGDTDSVPLLIDLLAQLPDERWPKDRSDTLRFNQAKEWFEKNLVGRRARRTPYGEIGFTVAGKGKYDVLFEGARWQGRREDLYGGKWMVVLDSSSSYSTADYVRVQGLSERAAERLRAQQGPPEVTFKIKSVQFGNWAVAVGDTFLRVEVADVTLKGIGP